jgi:hypothetical protein
MALLDDGRLCSALKVNAEVSSSKIGCVASVVSSDAALFDVVSLPATDATEAIEPNRGP